jgi:hypothetical protein
VADGEIPQSEKRKEICEGPLQTVRRPDPLHGAQRDARRLGAIARPVQWVASPGGSLCSAYRRTPESADPRVAFAFEDIGMDETIGGGAAGLEVDIVFQRWARRRTRS